MAFRGGRLALPEPVKRATLLSRSCRRQAHALRAVQLAMPRRQCEDPTGAWNEELFRVLEGFPDLAHDDEVDACSGALEMLNPRMGNWAHYEYMRQQAERLRAEQQQRKPQPAPTILAPGSMEWQAEQDKQNKSS